MREKFTDLSGLFSYIARNADADEQYAAQDREACPDILELKRVLARGAFAGGSDVEPTIFTKNRPVAELQRLHQFHQH
jgi:hypothetical protein